MKRVLALLGVCLSMMTAALAQGVFVEVVIDQDQYLSEEALVVKVRITNFSGRALQVGQQSDWLSLNVERPGGTSVSKRAPVEITGDFSLENSTTGIRKVDLSKHFDLSRPGHYTVTAFVKVPQVPGIPQSKSKPFDIIAGTKLWEQEFGLPPLAGQANSAPETRKYVLLQTTHQKAPKLYIRVSDQQEFEIFKTFPIGNIVSFSNPEPQIDQFSNLHVLYQASSRAFIYSVVNPDGVQLARETYDMGSSKPTLKASKEGRISVSGGTRRITASDIPAPMSSASATNAQTEQK